MFSNESYGFNTINQQDQMRAKSKKAAWQAAVQRFLQARRTGQIHQAFSRLTRKKSELPQLSQAIEGRQLKTLHEGGIRPVLVAMICGSEEKSLDFDAHFHPVNSRDQDRWSRVAAIMLSETGLPPVELIQVGDYYFVRDGRHRVSISRQIGQQYIDAHVLVMDTDPAPDLSYCIPTKSPTAKIED